MTCCRDLAAVLAAADHDSTDPPLSQDQADLAAALTARQDTRAGAA